MSDLPARLKIRRGSALQWQTVNPILASGELGYELDTKRLRIGDGVSSFTSLPFIEAGNATLSALAQITLGSSTSKSLEGGAVLFSGDVDSISPTGPRRVALEAIGTKPVETAYTDFTIRYDDDTSEQMAFTASGVYQRSMVEGDWGDWIPFVMESGVPIGTPILWTSTTIPAGYVEQGLEVSRAAYPKLWVHAQSSGMYDETGTEKTMFGPGDGSTTFDLPNWSDDVIRIWGNGSGIDPERALGSWQDEQVGPHSHDLPVRYWQRNYDGGATPRWDPNSEGTEIVATAENTGLENRMRNTTLMMIIRAY